MTGLYLFLTALFGLAIGLWLGMPGRYEQDADDIERIMESGLGRRGRRKTVFTPLAWLQRRASAKDTASRKRRSGGGGRGFRMESPAERGRD